MIKKVVPLLGNLLAIWKFADHKIVDSVSLRISKFVVYETRHLGDMLTFNHLLGEVHVVSIIDFDWRVELNVLFKLFDCGGQLHLAESLSLDYFLYKLGVLFVKNFMNYILWVVDRTQCSDQLILGLLVKTFFGLRGFIRIQVRAQVSELGDDVGLSLYWRGW
jgi:hypothetical protein